MATPARAIQSFGCQAAIAGVYLPRPHAEANDSTTFEIDIRMIRRSSMVTASAISVAEPDGPRCICVEPAAIESAVAHAAIGRLAPERSST